MKSWWRKGPAQPAAEAAPAAAPATPAHHAEQVLRRLEWKVIRRLDGLLQGDYRTLLRGTGLDLADLREYQLHDDVRHIDWNVTARLQMPHVRVFTEDREMSAWFLLDLSPSVDFGSGELRKRNVSAEFVAVLARLLTRHGMKDLSRFITYGASPRATINLVEGARALAMLRGRGYALPEDMTDLVPDVLRHRVVLSYEALSEGLSSDQVVQKIMAKIPAPAKPLEHEKLAA